GTGYRSESDPSREAATLDSCGIALVSRPVVAYLAEMFRPRCGVRANLTALSGPAGSGKTTIVGELARSARQQGFVPIASSLIGTRYAELCRGRSLFIIHGGSAHRFSAFLRAMTTTPQSHVLLIAGVDEVSGVDTVAAGRIDAGALIAALRPDVEDMDIRAARAARHAARQSKGLPGRFVDALWPGAVIHRDSRRRPMPAPSHAAERASGYGL